MKMRVLIDTMGYPEGKGILAVEINNNPAGPGSGGIVDLAIPGNVHKNEFGELIFEGEWKTEK